MVDWYSILTKYGVDIPNEEQIVIHCPFHEDRKESCAINLDRGHGFVLLVAVKVA